MKSEHYSRILLIVIPLAALWFNQDANRLSWPGELSGSWLFCLGLCISGIILNVQFKKKTTGDDVLSGVSLLTLFAVVFALGQIYCSYNIMRAGAGDLHRGMARINAMGE